VRRSVGCRQPTNGVPVAAVRVTTAARRARLVARHHLDASATSAVAAVRSVVAMHSSDPATPALAVLARTATGEPGALDAAFADLDTALYERRDLWRMHGMRRTMFVVVTEDGPVVAAAAGRDVARAERAKLESWLAADMDPRHIPGYLADVERRTVAALDDHGELGTQQLAGMIPELTTSVTVGGGRWTAKASLASRLLFLLALDGRVVRTRPAGTWRSSQYRWASTDVWFEHRPPVRDPTEARVELTRRYLAAYGPVTLTDLRWWTGWTATRARAAITAAGAVAVALDDDDAGFVLPSDASGDPEDRFDGASSAPGDGTPTVALLPGLDPTPMGWKERGWFLGDHAPALFDRNGNVGPTVWVDGRIVGGWAQRPDGQVVTSLLEPVSAEAADRIAVRAAGLTAWLGGTVVTPRFPTPLSRDLSVP
jgi:hypothetical protein